MPHGCVPCLGVSPTSSCSPHSAILAATSAMVAGSILSVSGVALVVFSVCWAGFCVGTCRLLTVLSTATCGWFCPASTELSRCCIVSICCWMSVRTANIAFCWSGCAGSACCTSSTFLLQPLPEGLSWDVWHVLQYLGIPVGLQVRGECQILGWVIKSPLTKLSCARWAVSAWEGNYSPPQVHEASVFNLAGARVACWPSYVSCKRDTHPVVAKR